MTESEIELLRAYEQSPIKPLFNKIIDKCKDGFHLQMESAQTEKDIFQIQGSLKALSAFRNLPGQYVVAHDRTQKEKALRAEMRGKVKPAPKSRKS